MRNLILIKILFLFLLPACDSFGQICKEWGEAQVVGKLDHNTIDEASGIAVSGKNSNVLYHVNDSGNGPYFYTTRIDGSETNKLLIKGPHSIRSDFEDMTIGPCYTKTCLFIADIGDNLKSRNTIKIIVIEENDKYRSEVTPLKIVNLSYPDRPHNAESLAIHTNGDLFIITKEENYKRQKSFPSKIYRIKKNKWETAGAKPLALEYIGTLDIELINSDSRGFLDNIITSFDISHDGKKFLVLTYQDAYEFNIDLSKANANGFSGLIAGKHYNTIKLIRLPQQESITYLPGSKSFIYNTEYKAITPKLIRVDCLK